MIKLTGKNLGKRQQELNILVNEAIAKNVNFDEVKAKTEVSDVDKLYKIDVASKLKNIDFIIEILKSGDSLHISRALKCIWLYDNEHVKFINPDFLHHNVFPYMSPKMKKKMLTTISIHVRDENRSSQFYEYCIESKLTNIALKFLIFTSEDFKLQLIKSGSQKINDELLHLFIGNSFILAAAYLETAEQWTSTVLHNLRHLYFVDSSKYLDLIEKYKLHITFYNSTPLGLRISKEILKKHKECVLKNPVAYIHMLNKQALIKNSSKEDAKLYATALLPPNADTFFNNYYRTYKDILNIISLGERFSFLKKIFSDKYPKQEFEMCSNFYHNNLYDTMTTEEQENWALSHIASEKEILGIGKDYVWYKFVSFSKAFRDIKKQILVATDKTHRTSLLETLVLSTRNLNELTELLKYYYNRHVNESFNDKETFVDAILNKYNFMEFDNDCWNVFNDILHSFEIYKHNNSNFIVIVLIYNIVKGNNITEDLKNFMSDGIIAYAFEDKMKKLSDSERKTVYNFILQFYIDKLESTDYTIYNDVAKQVKTCIRSVLIWVQYFDKEKNGIPEIVVKHAKLHWDEHKNYFPWETEKYLTQEQLMRYLKDDASMVTSALPEVSHSLQHGGQIRIFLKKLKIYFTHDIAKEYLEYFKNLLTCKETFFQRIDAAVYGIFQLADDKFKEEFMMKYVPENPKIEHFKMCSNTLHIQKAICSFACYSRPPVPLSNILMYAKGDYVHYCLPLFYSYSVNLPTPLCIKFVESILNAPLSIQKHGLRLAFSCFKLEDLKKLISDISKKTKNVSLRKVIYTKLMTTLLEEKGTEREQLFDILISLTLSLNEDDDDELFSILTRNNLPQDYKGVYLEAGWKAVDKLPYKSKNIERKINILKFIQEHIELIPENTLYSIIDEHVHARLTDKQILNKKNFNSRMEEVFKAKWEVVTVAIPYVPTQERLNRNLKLTNLIINKCLAMWNELIENTYVVREFCSRFIKSLDRKSFTLMKFCNAPMNDIFEHILDDLQKVLPIQDMYVIFWNLRSSIVTRKITIDVLPDFLAEDDSKKRLYIIKESLVSLSKEYGHLIKDFVEKNLFFVSFKSEISQLLNLKIDTMYLSYVLNSMKAFDFSVDDAIVLVASGLTLFESFEANILALSMLPDNYDGPCIGEYSNAIKKLEAFDNDEIQFNVCHKYQKDFKLKNFMYY